MPTTPDPLPTELPPSHEQPATPAPAPTPQRAPDPELEPATQEAAAPPTPPTPSQPKKRFSLADATPEQRSEWGKRGALKRAANKAKATSAPTNSPVAPITPKLDITKPEDRSTRGTIAVKARWEARNLTDHEWQTMPLLDAEQRLAAMRIDVERASRILQQRYQLDRDKPVTCIQCHASIQPGRWAQMKQERSAATGLVVVIYLCSERCIKIHHDAATAPLPGPPKGDPHAPSQYAPAATK